MDLPANPKTLKISDAATYLGVSAETLRRWEHRGLLIPHRTVGNQRFYTEAQLQDFQRQQGLITPPAHTPASDQTAEAPAQSVYNPTLRNDIPALHPSNLKAIGAYGFLGAGIVVFSLSLVGAFGNGALFGKAPIAATSAQPIAEAQTNDQPSVLAAATDVNESTGVAIHLPMPDSIADGTLICTDPKGTIPCEKAYDPNMSGVVTLSPSVVFEEASPAAGTKPVLTVGKTYVLVTTTAGAIKRGDFLTSSTKKGAAEKAIKSGYVLGTALEDFNSASKDTVGKVLVSLAIKPAVLTRNASDNLLDLIKGGLESAFLTPISALRYVLAAIVVASSVGMGLVYFGTITRKGIEAMGRNPLAGNRIQTSVILNVFLTIVIMAVGLAIAYIVLII